jgi:endonuclease YncB( thermonuclease family)
MGMRKWLSSNTCEFLFLFTTVFCMGGLSGWRIADYQYHQYQPTTVRELIEAEDAAAEDAIAPIAIGASTSPPDDRTVLLPCDVLKVHDGDTLSAVVYYPWGSALSDTIRCLGYDAWEVTKQRRTVVVTDEEVVKGKAARDALSKLLKSGDLVYITPQPASGIRDAYGRLLGFIRVKRDGKYIEVEKWMCEHGHCRQ